MGLEHEQGEPSGQEAWTKYEEKYLGNSLAKLEKTGSVVKTKGAGEESKSGTQIRGRS